MGLMYIGAALKGAGHEPKIHDCCRDRKNLHVLRRIIADWKPDFIGISIMITELEHTKRIMELIREILPDVPVTFSGSWSSANPEKAIKTFGSDFFVMGEGEKVFPELIDAITQGRLTESIPGTASMVNGHIAVNPITQLTEDELSALPFPTWIQRI